MSKSQRTESLLRRRGWQLGAAVGLSLGFLVALICVLGRLALAQADPDRVSWDGGTGALAADVHATSAVTVYGGELRYGLVEEPVSLDPIQHNAPRVILGQIFEGLLAYDENWHLVPAIATSWETVDAQTFTFTLRSDVFFHNGRRLTAQDVVSSWKRLNSDIISATAALDATTLRVTLDHPQIQWLYKLPEPSYAVIPSETVPTIDWHPVGSGPFRFESWDHGAALTLTANTDYYAGRPYLDSLRFAFYPDQQSMYAAFQAGEIDYSEVPSIEIASLSGNPNLIEHTIAAWRWVWMTVDVSPTNQITVRQALNYALDRQAVLTGTDAVVPAHRQQADVISLPGLQGYNPVFTKSYGYSPTLALDLLYSAGYTDTVPKDGILDDGVGNDLAIEIWTNDGSTIRKTAASLVADQWRDIGGTGVGLSVTTVFAEWNLFLDNIFGKTMPSYVVGFLEIPMEPFFTLDMMFRTGGTWNLTGYSSPQVDAWLDQSMSTISLTQRHTLYQQIEERVLDDVPVIPLWYRGRVHIKDSCVNGLVVPLNEDIPLEDVYACGTSEILEPATGTTLIYTDLLDGLTVVQVPTGSVTSTTVLVYRPVDVPVEHSGFAFAGRAFELDAYRGDVLLADLFFEKPVTITLYYTDTDIAGLSEDALLLYYWDDKVGQWKDAACGEYVRHPSENWLAVPVCHLSQFALFGQHHVYLSVVLRGFP